MKRTERWRSTGDEGLTGIASEVNPFPILFKAVRLEGVLVGSVQMLTASPSAQPLSTRSNMAGARAR